MSDFLNRNRTGVILAAGFGSRLAGSQMDTDLKPLTLVGGEPLIFRTIKSLEKAGCNLIVIVLGFAFEEIKDDITTHYNGKIKIEFAYNDKYKLQNGLSVLAAEKFIDEEFILTMADHVLSDEMMLLAGKHNPPKNGVTLLVDYKLDTIFDMDDATKVKTSDNKIERIGKQINDYNCVDTGVFVCTKGLLHEIKNVYQKRGDASLSDGIQALANSNRMLTLDIGQAWWQDVDTPEMLQHAEGILRVSAR